MTDKSRLRIEVALLAAVFGGGAGWGAIQIRMGNLEATVARIDQRVTAIYCSNIPEPQRLACR